MNANCAFIGSYIEIFFWYQHSDLRQEQILSQSQSVVDFDPADNCPLYVTTVKAMNFQDYKPSIPIDSFKEHYVLVFYLTSIQDATENCHYPELVVGTEAGANFFFSSRTRYLTHCFGGKNVFGCS